MDYNLHWKQKHQRIKTAQEHVEKMDKKYFNDICKSVNKTFVYNEYFTSNRYDVAPTFINIKVVKMDVVSAIFKYAKKTTAVLNFASYTEPCSGYLKGANAQEESLCANSTLYNVLLCYPDFYKENSKNLNDGLYTNRAIYSKDIIFHKGKKECYIDVLTCAAPNKRSAIKYENFGVKKNHDALKSRINYIFDIIVENKVDTLILGAYGCGKCGQNATEVASLFLNAIEEKGKFAFPLNQIIFAIPKNKHNNNYSDFKKVLLKNHNFVR